MELDIHGFVLPFVSVMADNPKIKACFIYHIWNLSRFPCSKRLSISMQAETIIHW